MKRIWAMSLIEVLAVLSIISILSIAAVPTYTSYIIRTRLSKARSAFNSYNSFILDFYNAQQVFPTNSDLSVSASVPTSIQNYLIPPYLAQAIFAGPQTRTSTQCNFSFAQAYISNYDNGDYFANGTSKYTVLYNYFIVVNNVIQTQCMDYEYDPAIGQVTNKNYYPDCYNSNNVATTPIQTLINTGCG